MQRTVAVVGVAVLMTAAVTVAAPRVLVSTLSMRLRMGSGPGVGPGRPLEQLVTVKRSVSTDTIVLLTGLAGTYARLY